MYQPKTAEENWTFNTKRPIPANKQIAYKDGNPKNISFANLKLEAKKEEPKEEIKKEEPKKEPKPEVKTKK
jgi:hypothetical protein